MNEKKNTKLFDFKNDYMYFFVSCLLVAGLILFPIHMRYLLLKDTLKILSRINVFFLLGMVLLLYQKVRERDFSLIDKVMVLLWGFSALLMCVSNYSIKTGRTLVAFCMLLAPTFIVLYRFRAVDYRKFMKWFLIAFDAFVVFLLILSIIEKQTNSAFLRYMAETLDSKEFRIYLEGFTFDVWRAHTIWGHALLNAVFYNAFFIINDLYFTNAKIKYPKILFFIIALAGVLLCASKTAIVVVLAYLVVSSWKNKKFLIGSGVVLVISLLAGAFNSLFERLTMFSLTSGRMDHLIGYFKSGIYPFKFLIGYGTNSVFDTDVVQYKAGFEFSILMSALDHGILFAIFVFLGVYIYASYQMLKRKNVQCWLGYSLLFAQLNTFNGLGLSNQDTFTWLCLFTMLSINCAVMGQELPTENKIDTVEQELEPKLESEHG